MPDCPDVVSASRSDLSKTLWFPSDLACQNLCDFLAGSIQNFYVIGALFQENSMQKASFSVPEVSMQKNLFPRPRQFQKAGSQKTIFLYREFSPRKFGISPGFPGWMGSGRPKSLYRPRQEKNSSVPCCCAHSRKRCHSLSTINPSQKAGAVSDQALPR